MSSTFKKYITFLIYAIFILTPALYWVKSSWGLSGLLNIRTIFNLATDDISFLLTLLSVIGAMIIGFVSILLNSSDEQINIDPAIPIDGLVIQNDNLKTRDNSVSSDLPPPPVLNISGIVQEDKTDREPIISMNYDEVTIVKTNTNYFDDVLKSKGYKTFDVKMIDGFNLLFFAISNKNILFGYSMPFVGEIITNELISEDSILNHPLWFSHMHRFMSPVFAVKEIRKSIDDLLASVLPKDHDITIESYCVLDDKAIILNLDDAQKVWANDSINVVMQSKPYKTISTFNDVLEDNSTNEILPSFLEFAKTMEQYFIQKARISALKKV